VRAACTRKKLYSGFDTQMSIIDRINRVKKLYLRLWVFNTGKLQVIYNFAIKLTLYRQIVNN
jgi:hypothetical protein